jgi:hypothetical protein
MNFGWADVEEGAWRTTNTRVIPRILSTCQSFHGSRAYSIHSFAQLFWHSTGETNLWTGRSRIPSFLIPFSSQRFFAKTCKPHFGWADVGRKEEFTTHTLSSKHPIEISIFS